MAMGEVAVWCESCRMWYGGDSAHGWRINREHLRVHYDSKEMVW